jgi:hypothetical protein
MLSGPTLLARHSSWPLFRSSATSHPVTPSSPPELPTYTLPWTTNGAIVVVAPCAGFAILVRHSSLPVPASMATVCPSSTVNTSLPSA